MAYPKESCRDPSSPVRWSVLVSDHDYSVFILRPLSATIFAICLILVLWPGVKKRLGHGGAEVT